MLKAGSLSVGPLVVKLFNSIIKSEIARAAILARYYSTLLLIICLSYYMKGNAIQYRYIHARSIF